MIIQSEKNAIVKTFGKHYSAPIIEYLNKRKIFNIKGNPFLKTSIQNIVNGEENEVVEAAIFKLIAITKEIKEKEKLTRKQILKK